jgi:hypothetical protein
VTLLSQIPVIDVDTHLIEPPDLWTSRLPKRWADDAPHLEWDDSIGKQRWHVGRHALSPATQFDVVGWREFHPSIPPCEPDICCPVSTSDARSTLRSGSSMASAARSTSTRTT